VSIEPTGRRKEDVIALTQALATAFERAIAAAPPDWHMFQPAWDA
jgi:lauroyl/myristoyl acyltransferase